MVVLASAWFQYDYNDQLDVVWETLALGGDIIIVTVNHRLGVLGFIDSTSNGTSAAAGIEDVFLSLAWIREHIESFEGDPKSLVGFGFGSGSYLTSIDLFAEKLGKKSVFKRLVLHGLSPTSLLPRTERSSLAMIATSMQCKETAGAFSHIDCLKDASLKSISETTSKFPWLLFTPGCDRPPFGGCDNVFAKLTSTLTGISILCGHNTYDGDVLFQYILSMMPRQSVIPDNPEILFNYAQKFFTGNRTAQKVPPELQQYLEQGRGSNVDKFKQLLSDMVLRCPMMELAHETSAKGAVVHVYNSYGDHKLLDPAVMMADIIAFVKTGHKTIFLLINARAFRACIE
ncbi:hypothetical protein V5799_015926 [Amblyomma americanum]|uniref:Carboxylesterase type B domain-containing protein n=1 Tax=Amblyomma americanum TaxID=6943 RepID=A0AAQ4F6G6_AMBAM